MLHILLKLLYNPGAMVQAAVSSVEDHGYVMEVGIGNTRSFLPKAATNPELQLGKSN